VTDVGLTTVEYGDPSGVPLLALHGGGNTHVEWARIAMVDMPYRRWICPDLLGHGASPRAEPWTFAHHVECIVATLDRLGLDRVDVIGMSLGARLVAELCAAAPDRVGAAVQLDPPLMTREEWAGYVARHPPPPLEYQTLDDAIHARDLTAEGQQEARRVMLAGLERAPDGRLRRRAAPEALAGMYRALGENPSGHFGDFRGPVLLMVAGDHDMHTPAGVEARRAELGDRLTLVTVEGVPYRVGKVGSERFSCIVGH
jgi:pimeloyl-ACP methyl ester carboxylesterase